MKPGSGANFNYRRSFMDSACAVLAVARLWTDHEQLGVTRLAGKRAMRRSVRT